jgi:hypothetical protein
VSADATTIRFVVTDTGIGIAARHLERVFDSFWQVEQRKTRTAGGSGLGLTVSRRIARLLGGDVSAANVPGTGSRFVFTIPRTRACGGTERPGVDGAGERRPPLERAGVRLSLERGDAPVPADVPAAAGPAADRPAMSHDEAAAG